MNIFLNGIHSLMRKKTVKKNELFSIFKDYVKATQKLNALKVEEKELALRKIKNQIDEYYIAVSDLAVIVDMSKLDENLLVYKIKHISEIKPEVFTFTDLYATPSEEGVLLSADKKSLSELIRIVSYKKV